MSKMTIDELKEWRSEHGEAIWQVADDIYGDRAEEVAGIGAVRNVAGEGGEGEGDEYWVCFSITTDDGEVTHYRKEGHYSSYDGVDWDYGDLYEAVAKPVTVIEWVAK